MSLMSSLKRFRKYVLAIKQNIVVILLITILLVLLFPTLTKSFSSAYKGYINYREQIAYQKLEKIQLKLLQEEETKENLENTRRYTLLKKYGITKLENYTSCSDSSKSCPIQFKIPDNVTNYLLGSYLDKRLNSSLNCKYSQGKNENNYVGNRINYTYLINLPIRAKLEEKEASITKELKELGYYVDNDKELFSNAFNECDRLNAGSLIEDFKKEVPAITNLIRENPKDPILDGLSKSYINFTILSH